MVRLPEQPLNDLEAEDAVSTLVDIIVPTEAFPFKKRRAIRELLRLLVETVQ